MSVLIKGVEMPKDCTECWFRKTARHEYLVDCQLCPFTGDPTPYTKRKDNCPLIPVQPHGRLIDADALEMERRAENAKKGWHDSFAVVFNGDPYYEANYDCTEQFKELVNNAPTIIPAEEGET